MELQNKFTTFRDVDRTWGKTDTRAKIEVEEFATFYSISLKIVCYNSWATRAWKYKKTKYKTVEEAIAAHIREAYNNRNI